MQAITTVHVCGSRPFGPWEVTARKTRGGVANAKRWAILFTCLTSRAVHIELVDEMTSSAFINSLRRFVAMRGKVTEFYSDRGTNFVGSTDALKINAINIESPTLKKYMVKMALLGYLTHHMHPIWEGYGKGSFKQHAEFLMLSSWSQRNHLHMMF